MGSDIGQVLLVSGGTLGLGGKHKNQVSAHLENSRRERGKPISRAGSKLRANDSSVRGSGWRVWGRECGGYKDRGASRLNL